MPQLLPARSQVLRFTSKAKLQNLKIGLDAKMNRVADDDAGPSQPGSHVPQLLDLVASVRLADGSVLEPKPHPADPGTPCEVIAK